MKTCKKIFSLLMTLAVLSATILTGITGLPALCAQASGSTGQAGTGMITVQHPEIGADYTAYKIFDVTYDQKGGNYSYYINKTDPAYNLLNQSGAAYVTLTLTAASSDRYLVGLKDGVSAASFALFLKNNESALGEGVRQKAVAAKDQNGKDTEEAADLAFKNLPLGYYFVTTSTGALCNLTTTDNTAVIHDKNDFPDIDKNILAQNGQGGTTPVKGNTASVGETVTYQITGTVPDMTGYKKYYYIVKDTLSDGLTLVRKTKNGTNGNAGSAADDTTFTITAGGAALVNGTDYTVEYGENNQSFQIIFIDFYGNYKDHYGEPIVITYSAIVNEKALQTDKESNTAQLIYSNDPTSDSKGDPENPDKPDPDKEEPTGESPRVTTYTYDTGIQLNKINEKKEKLIGAKFRIEGNASKVSVLNGTMYEKAEDGTFWKLKDGTYTKTDPNSENMDKTKYDSLTEEYKKTETITLQNYQSDRFTAEAYVDSTGKLTFTGLGAGTYTITELIAPDGYNLLKDPITVTITAAVPKDGSSVTWTVMENGTTKLEKDKTTGLYVFNVENKNGTILPETGGTGTFLLYFAGAALAVFAAAMILLGKRLGKWGRR